MATTGTDLVLESDGSYSKQVRGLATAGLPTSLGQKTAANSTSVVLASDQGTVTMAHTTATATGTTSAMLASNANRKYALLQNDGSVDVYIKLNAAAVASQGIRLLANGGSYEMSLAFGNLDTRAVNGITASGSAVVLVVEG